MQCTVTLYDGKRSEVSFLRAGRCVTIYISGGWSSRRGGVRDDGKRMEVYFLRAGRCVTIS